VFEPEPRDENNKKDVKAQEKLIKKTETWLNDNGYIFATVFSGGSSVHFWIVMNASINNEQRKKITFWLCNQLRIGTSEVDMSSVTADHMWALPGVHRISKKKMSALLSLNNGTRRMDMPILNDDEFLKLKRSFGIIDIDKITQGVGKGERDINAIRYATWLRRCGKTQEQATIDVRDWNVKNKPPLSDKQLLMKVKSAYKHHEPYGFVFSKEPPKEEKTWLFELSEILDEKLDEDGKVIRGKGGLVINHFVKWLSSEFHFIVLKDNDKMLVYEDGMYVPGGDIFIESFVQKHLVEEDELSFARNNPVKEIVGCIKRMNRVKREDINPERYLCLENGLYDLKAKKLIPHTPNIICTFRLPVKFDGNADCPKFKSFLSQVSCKENIDELQEMFGYCLQQDYRFQYLFVLYGRTGANGKGVLLRVLTSMLGEENVSGVSLQDIENEKFAKAWLYGKLANVCTELSDTDIKSTGAIKLLTGEEMVFANEKFEKPFHYYNHAKLVFSSNKLPHIHDSNDGIWRRVKIFDFPNTFEGAKRDTQLKNKLVGELSGIFNWSLIGLDRLLKQNEFSYPAKPHEMQTKWRLRSNHVIQFIDDCLEYDIVAETSTETIYNEYKIWCSKQRLSPISEIRVFGRILKQSTVAPIHPVQVGELQLRGWKGIRVKNITEKLETQ
jgi:putative DNA primase/helicase